MTKSSTKNIRRDVTKWPMEIIRSFTMKLEGDEDYRYVSEFPEFVDMPAPYLTEDLGIFNSPHEFCLITALEFARRYPGHGSYQFYKKEFNDSEILDIVKGKRKIIFKSYNDDPDKWKHDMKTEITRGVKKILPRLSRPDFSKEPVELVHIYDYWLEGDNLEGKPRGGVNVPQFSQISFYKAELNKWVRDDADYTIMADIEFCRRNPKHEYAKKSQYYKLFLINEIIDISMGRKKLIIESSYE